MYDELVKSLREDHGKQYFARDMEAADATEELQGWNNSLSDSVEMLMKQIAELSKRVPKAPHGRLIDADAFLSLINDSTILSDFLKCIISPLIRGEPTVIEAKEVTNDQLPEL